MSEREWDGVTGGTTLGQKAMKITFSVVNVRFGYVILALVVPFYMLFCRKGYRSIYRYFRRQHGYSSMKSFFYTYRNHFVFGQAMLDRFAVYAGQKNFKVDSPDNDVFTSMLESPHGCIVAGAHVGNPELCGYLLRQQKKRINCLIYGGEAKEVQKNRTKILARNNIRTIPVSEDMSHIFLINEALKDGEMVSMTCDRTFGSSKSVECDFLNGKADFPVGAFVLGRQFDVPVLAMFALKTSTSQYSIRIVRILVPAERSKREQIESMTRTFVRELERVVKEYPEQWFNFYNFWKDKDVSCA